MRAERASKPHRNGTSSVSRSYPRDLKTASSERNHGQIDSTVGCPLRAPAARTMRGHCQSIRRPSRPAQLRSARCVRSLTVERLETGPLLVSAVRRWATILHWQGTRGPLAPIAPCADPESFRHRPHERSGDRLDDRLCPETITRSDCTVSSGLIRWQCLERRAAPRSSGRANHNPLTVQPRRGWLPLLGFGAHREGHFQPPASRAVRAAQRACGRAQCCVSRLVLKTGLIGRVRTRQGGGRTSPERIGRTSRRRLGTLRAGCRRLCRIRWS
jgi:hypothetical protein